MSYIQIRDRAYTQTTNIYIQCQLTQVVLESTFEPQIDTAILWKRETKLNKNRHKLTLLIYQYLFFDKAFDVYTSFKYYYVQNWEHTTSRLGLSRLGLNLVD